MNAIRVIFVDDEPRVLEGLKRMLRPKRNEWQMTFVGSAQAALDALKAEPCEVVVTDMRMPGMNGAELLEVVQRDYPDTIRLILSGQAETESVMKALGVSHQFLSKPCDAEILQGTISRAFALRDLAGSESVKTLVARINKLPTLPATYQKLVETLRQPNSSIEDVSNVIATDPAMTARLLKLVNSAYFGLQKPVADVARAGALLGLDRIMALVLGQGIFSDCEPPKVEGFSMEALWHHSVTTAAAAHRIAIAEQLDRDHVAAAFLAGMLHDIGKLVLAMGLPEQYAKVLKQVGRPARRPAADRDARAARRALRRGCLPRRASGACLTPSPKPSRITKILRSRRTRALACRASCTSRTGSRIGPTSPTSARPSSG